MSPDEEDELAGKRHWAKHGLKQPSCSLGCDCANKSEEEKCDDCKKGGMGCPDLACSGGCGKGAPPGSKLIADGEEMDQYIASLGAVKVLGQGWSSNVNGHAHPVIVVLNPDTVVAFFKKMKGHIHVVSVPIADVIAAEGVITSSIDVDHEHQIKINVSNL